MKNKHRDVFSHSDSDFCLFSDNFIAMSLMVSLFSIFQRYVTYHYDNKFNPQTPWGYPLRYLQVLNNASNTRNKIFHKSK